MPLDPRSQAAARLLQSPLGKWAPWVYNGRSPQAEFIRAAGRKRYRIFRGGNRSGKTSVLVADALLTYSGWHPASHPTPDGRPRVGWCVARDWELGHGQVLWPKFASMLPKNEIEDIAWVQRKKPAIASAIIWKNGNELHMKSAAAGEDKFAGAALDDVYGDEEVDGSIVDEIRQRLTTRAGAFAWALTPLRRDRWVLDLERQPFCITIRARQLDAARAGLADVAYVEEFLASLPERQRVVRDLGDYAALEGLVWPEFSRGTHLAYIRDGGLFVGDKLIVTWPPPPSWTRIAGHDFGYVNGAATPVLAVAPEGDRVVVERCMFQREVMTSTWGRLLHEHADDGRPLVPPGTTLVCDHDADGRAELSAAGWLTCAANKEIHPGLDTVARLLMPSKRDGLPTLLFAMAAEGTAPPRHPAFGRVDAHHLVEEITGYRYPPRREGALQSDVRDLPIKKADHACFAGETLVATPSGPRRIDEIRVGDEVWTPVGAQRVEGAGVTRLNAPMVSVTIGAHATITCTPDHRFAYEADVHGRELLPLRLLLQPSTQHQQPDPQGTDLFASRRVEGIQPTSDPEGMPCTPPRRGPIEQPPVEPRVDERDRAPSPAHDAGTPSAVEHQHPSGDQGRSRVAPHGGGPRVASAACAQGRRRDAVPHIRVHRMWRAIREPHDAEGGSEVLRGDVQDACVQARASGILQAVQEEVVVEDAEPRDAWCIAVPCGTFILADGWVVKNCDGLRYVCHTSGLGSLTPQDEELWYDPRRERVRDGPLPDPRERRGFER